MSRRKLYPLIEILFVVLCGSICGAESWRDFVLFGESKIDRLKKHYPFSKVAEKSNEITAIP
ncbi:MAG: transposase family protein [Legionella sp.]